MAVVLAIGTVACSSKKKSEPAPVASSDPLVATCEGSASETAQVACNDLGDKYAEGKGGLTPDPAKGATYYEKACDKGMRLACRNLGNLYIDGRGVAVNRVKGIELLDRSCAAGLGLACDELGDVYDQGKANGSIDAAKAVNVYTRGCEINSGRSCRMLGKHYKDGSGVPKDVNRGIGYYEKGCTTDRLTCDDLGDVYAKGEGVPVDKKKAAVWYQKGCNAGLDLSCTHLKALE
jgi:TPR repeat protein